MGATLHPTRTFRLPLPLPSVTASTAPYAAPRAAPTHRILGALGMLGSPVFLVQWLFLATPDGRPAETPLGTYMDLAYLAGWMCSTVAIRAMRATGRRRGAAVLFALQVVGLLLAAGQEIQDLMQRRPFGDAFYGVTDFSWPLSHLLMIAVGVAVLRANVWTGWRRWAPLACGMALPIGLASGAAFGQPALMATFGIGTAAAFFALGLAVWSAPEVEQPLD